MLIKNPTGIVQVYGFASLTLQPGQTAEIDNSYVENASFQDAKSGGALTILEYNKNIVEETVKLYLSESPNLPSNDQKGAMVKSASPSTLNPFAVCSQLFLLEPDLEYVDAKTISLSAGSIVIGTTLVTLESDISCVVDEVFTIDAAGNSTGILPVASTKHDIYVSTSKTLRLSTAVVTNLAWKKVGFLYNNINRQLDGPLSICNGLFKYDEVIGLTGVQVAQAGGVVEAIEGASIKVAENLDMLLTVYGKIDVASSVSGELISIYINDIKMCTVQIYDEDVYYTVSFSYIVPLGLQRYNTYTIGMKGPSTNHYTDRANLNMTVKKE